jgi:hypothetical protein
MHTNKICEATRRSITCGGLLRVASLHLRSLHCMCGERHNRHPGCKPGFNLCFSNPPDRLIEAKF